MNHYDQVKDIETAIAKHRIEKAIDKLTMITKDLQLKDLEKLVLLQSAKFNTLEDNRLSGDPPPVEEYNLVSKNLLDITRRLVPFLPASGKIITPTNYSFIKKEFEVRIALRNFDKNKYYWLSHKIGEWQFPKKPLFIDGNLIDTKSSEWGSPEEGRFSLCLFEVSAQVHQDLQRWLDGSDFSGIRIAGVLLDSVNLKLK